jgi:hypothetical protein
VHVAQRLVQVGAGGLGADPAIARQDAHEHVLDEVLGVLARAGHGTGGALQRGEVGGERGGEEYIGHTARFPAGGSRGIGDLP